MTPGVYCGYLTFHEIWGGFTVTDIRTASGFSSDMEGVILFCLFVSAKLQLKQESNALGFLCRKQKSTEGLCLQRLTAGAVYTYLSARISSERMLLVTPKRHFVIEDTFICGIANSNFIFAKL